MNGEELRAELEELELELAELTVSEEQLSLDVSAPPPRPDRLARIREIERRRAELRPER